MAAIEAQLNGYDPEPLLEIAEMGQKGFCAGVELWFARHRNIPEKLNMVRPTEFVNGGEYGKTPEDIQKGFGMTIGAYRVLKVRNLRDEVYNAKEKSWRQDTLRRMGYLALAA